MPHPDRLDLLRYVFEAAAQGESAVTRHVHSCADCAAQVHLLRDAGGMLRASSGAQEESAALKCLEDDIIAVLAEGTVDAATRAEALPHLARCSRCRVAVASVAHALADSSVARDVATIRGDGWRRVYRVALPAALAAAALLIVVRPREGDFRQPHRAPTITASPAPVLMSPLGAVANAQFLRWAGVAGADRYRVILFDATGGALYETQLSDTVAVLPDSIVLTPGLSYLWKVEARTGFDRWSTSELVQFSIAGGAPR